MLPAWLRTLVLILFAQLPAVIAADGEITSSSSELLDDRRPALYTGEFGNCMENPAITINRFDAAYYVDNMTVVFNIDGQTTLVNENLMIYLTVNAYGESRFNLIFNPCNANLPSLCPARASVNISAAHAIPVSPSDVAGIPKIAFHIPDFEGRADLRIFSNSTRRQIACVTALVTNGNSFSHPKIISLILAGFAIVVCLASFVAAISGNGIINSRELYAHSLSVYIVFSCYHSIYFTGALSVNFPSVLIAFWSNFAWASGIITNESMQNSLNNFTRKSARSADTDLDTDALKLSKELYSISKRSFRFGKHQKEGLPIPGNFSGFPATLAEAEITSTNAFMTAFVWFLVLLMGITILISGFKFTLETLTVMGLRKTRLQVFRDNWLAFLRSILLRTAFIAFFPIVLLATFQFTVKEPGPQSIAGIVFAIMVVGIFTAATYAYLHRWRGGKLRLVRESRVISLERKFGFFPWCKISRRSSITAGQKSEPTVIPWWKLSIETYQERASVHEEELFIRRFGWLSARFRRRRWWFFGPWLFYEFLRALFYGGGQENSKAQVFGLLAIEIIAFGLSVFANPFQSVRLNALMVYLFGIMKIATLAIIAAFIMHPSLNRIIVTVLGIVIIVFQGITTLVVIIFSAVNVYTTYFGISSPESQIKSESCMPAREKYLGHIKARSIDIDPPPKAAPVPPQPVVPSFSVTDVRRYPKIDDEYDDQVGSLFSGSSRRGTPNIPSGARLPRQTWSPSPRWSNEDVSSIPQPNSRTDWPLLNSSLIPVKDSFKKETSSSEAHDSRLFETDVHTFPQKF